jgi:hypothetical protein
MYFLSYWLEEVDRVGVDFGPLSLEVIYPKVKASKSQESDIVVK